METSFFVSKEEDIPMQALLLAGGLGTRLRPLTEDWPKPMALLGNRPWLEHLIVMLKRQGVDDIVLAVKHCPEKIQQHFGYGDRWGVTIRYVVERTLLGTAGAIKNAESLLRDRFLVFNADIIQTFHLRPFIEGHVRRGGGVSICLTEVEDPSHYGVVEQDADGRILRFVEKPRPEEAPSRKINAGIYMLDKAVLADIPAGKEVSIEREMFPGWIRKGVPVYGHDTEGYWMDMGTTKRYRQVHRDLLDRKLDLPVSGTEVERGVWIGENSEVHPGALIVPPVLIGNRVTIGEKAVIGPYTVIGDDCRIKSGARLMESILWNRCTVETNAVLNNCIFGHGLTIGTRHVMHEAVMSRIGVSYA
jgi:mannose-1-phosphate guanylyltransferase